MNPVVNFLVGKNGSGKTLHLKSIARKESLISDVLILCNTVHDKFFSGPSIKKMSVGSLKSRPNNIIKEVILKLREESGAGLNVVGKVLDYTGYQPRLVLKCKKNRRARLSDVEDRVLRDDLVEDKDVVLKVAKFLDGSPEYSVELDLSRGVYSSLSAMSLLSVESVLRRYKYISPVQLYIFRKISGDFEGSELKLKLEDASSGELTLITTLSFVMANITPRTVLLIDEPENSLHPTWQKEYVINLINNVYYYAPRIYIATHAPILLSGAQADEGVDVDIYNVSTGTRIRSGETAALEEMLLDVFDVVTPVNHFLSDELVRIISSIDRGVPLEQVRHEINRLQEASYDSQQEKVFLAAQKLASEIAGEA